MRSLRLLTQSCAQVFQATEQESPGSLAYDTPSPKLLAFLQKHYGESGLDAGTAGAGICLWLRSAPLSEAVSQALNCVPHSRLTPADFQALQHASEPEHEYILQGFATSCHRITGS